MPKHLIISVHGIQTLARWQAALREMILAVEPSAVVHEYQYSVVSAYSLFPGRREQKVKRFAAQLQSEFEREQWDRIDIVAHSFGTFIVAEALRYLARNTRPDLLPQIETLILAGSVLPSRYPWRELVPGFVRRLVNDCGVIDHVLWLPELLIPGLGFGGRVGFEGLTGHDLHNRRFLFGHSGFFADPAAHDAPGFMQQWWLPLLTQETKSVPSHDARPQRRLPTLVGWLERQVNVVRACALSVLLSIPVLLASAYVGQLRSHNQQLLAESWALRSMQLRDTASTESKRLAIASAKLHKTPQTEHALLQALASSARPVLNLPYEGDRGVRSFAVDHRGTKLAQAGTDASGRLLVRMHALSSSARSQPTVFALPDQGCSLKQQPEGLSFSETGRYLALKAFHGSCVLDVQTMRWAWDLPGYEHVTFSHSDSVFYASRSATGLEQQGIALLSIFSPEGRRDISSTMRSGWLRDIAIVADSGAVAADATGRAWVVPRDNSPAVQIHLPDDDPTAQSVAASRDGQRVAIGTERGSVFVVSADGLRAQWRSSLKSPPVKLRFSGDGKRLAALLADGTARVWSSHDGAQLAAFDGGGYPLDLRFLGEDADRLLTVNRDAGIKVWSVPAQSLLARVPTPVRHDGYAFDDSGRAVLAADDGGTATLWDTTWQSEDQALHLEEGIRSLVVRGNGRYVAALGEGEQLRVWDTSNRQLLLDIPKPTPDRSAWRSNIELSENGGSVAMIDDSGKVQVWRPGRGRVFALQLPRLFADAVVPLGGSRRVLRSLPQGTDPRLVEGCSADVPINLGPTTPVRVPDSEVINRTCQVFDPEKTLPIGLVSTDTWLWRAPLALSADGGLLALAFVDDVFVFDVESGRVLAKFALGYERKRAPFAARGADFGAALARWLSFSDDARHLLVATREDPIWASGGNLIRSWSLDRRASAQSRVLALDPSHMDLGFFPQLNSVISLSDGSSQLNLWNTKNFKLQRTVSVQRFIDGVLSTPRQPGLLVVLSHDPVAQMPRYFRTPYVHVDVFDSKTLDPRSHVAIPFPVEKVVPSPDGRSLLVEDGSGNARTVDLVTGAVLAEFGLGTKPRAVWFRADGALFYTSGGQMQYANTMAGENQIRSIVWETDELIRRLCSSLRPSDRDFSALSHEAGKPVSCDP